MGPANVSVVPDELTARTCSECASQRAANLHKRGVRTVLELCVGPSLPELERVYSAVGIRVVGNDIDPRWRRHYPKGQWLLGDALSMSLHGFDAVVFAPPLSRGCTGKRDDSLSVSAVEPSYRSFLERLQGFRGIAVLVLPGRSLATSWDRRQFFDLTGRIQVPFEAVPLRAGRRGIVKYYDIYLDHRSIS